MCGWQLIPWESKLANQVAAWKEREEQEGTRETPEEKMKREAERGGR